MKIIRFNTWYHKLGLRAFSTVRKAGWEGKAGDNVLVEYPDGTRHEARVLHVLERALDDLPGEFLVADTDAATREDAVTLLRGFYPGLHGSTVVSVIRVEYLDTVRLDCYVALLPKFKERFPMAHFEVITRQGASSPLSPSWSLLEAIKSGALAWEEYGVRLVAEIHANQEARARLKRLRGIASERVTFLVCFEKDPARCHRSIVKKLVNETR